MLDIAQPLKGAAMSDFFVPDRTPSLQRLFYQVFKGRNTYVDVAGKLFSRLVRKLGITDKALVLHSLRHGRHTKLSDTGHHAFNVIAGTAIEYNLSLNSGLYC
jgi:hypothetical protein